jgi:glycosyltransferase involved in cell wall biosynthesis
MTNPVSLTCFFGLPVVHLLITILLSIWLLMLVVQLVFILFVYARTAYRTLGSSAGSWPARLAIGPDGPGVTVIVCAHNERENLAELLPLLDAQEYPVFEVLLIDDRSDDGTEELLRGLLPRLSHCRSIRIDTSPAHTTPKKYALTIALKKAVHEAVLLTDADCRPAGSHWVAGMVDAMIRREQKNIVLGVSPYEYRPGWLNRLIRYETLFTAVQYLSMALIGQPYMGVGRNLMYRKSVFFDNKGFYSHLNIVGGDDDLFMNEVATGQNTVIALDPATFVYSKPKETWADWRLQKQRHLNVGKFYRPAHKARLALLMGSQVLTWMLALPALARVVTLLAHGRAEILLEPLLLIASVVFVWRLLAFWIVVSRISTRLGEPVKIWAIPALDLGVAMYYGIIGTLTLLQRRQRALQWR